MTTITVYRGNQIAQSHVDPLKETALYEIYSEIREDEGLREEIERIRKVAKVDKQAYSRVKTRLPYFCCASFDNHIRKSDRFLHVQAFVLDIDNILDQEVMVKIREEISRDPRVKMLFTSPGGKGLKAVFELTAPCVSLKEYSDFYKIFAYRFCEAYLLEGMIDFSTCDATRVTFLSSDPDAIFNALNETVTIGDFLPRHLSLSSEANGLSSPQTVEAPKNHNLLDEFVYHDILRTLNPNTRIPKREKQIFVPEELNQLENAIRAEIEKIGLVIKEIRDIHYGKKVAAAHGIAFGEVNIFFGKRGFSVVRSPKSGSDSKLCGILEMIIWKVLSEFKHPMLPLNEDIFHIQN